MPDTQKADERSNHITGHPDSISCCIPNHGNSSQQALTSERLTYRERACLYISLVETLTLDILQAETLKIPTACDK